MGQLRKKDFIQIAKIINKETMQDTNGFNYLPVELFLDSLCEYLKTTNGQFKENEFKKACGVEENEPR